MQERLKKRLEAMCVEYKSTLRVLNDAIAILGRMKPGSGHIHNCSKHRANLIYMRDALHKAVNEAPESQITWAKKHSSEEAVEQVVGWLLCRGFVSEADRIARCCHCTQEEDDV
jgi:hypothetical protein